MVTRRTPAIELGKICYTLQMEPENALLVTQEELAQFKTRQYLELVSQPTDTNMTGTKMDFQK